MQILHKVILEVNRETICLDRKEIKNKNMEKYLDLRKQGDLLRHILDIQRNKKIRINS